MLSKAFIVDFSSRASALVHLCSSLEKPFPLDLHLHRLYCWYPDRWDALSFSKYEQSFM